MLKAIVFDFDGVIGDTFDLAIRICRESGKSVSASVWRNHHNGNVYEEPAVSFTAEESNMFWVKYSEYADAKNLFPLAEQLKKLAKQYKLFLMSSSKEKAIEKYLSLGGISEPFEKILGRETHRSKVEKFKMIFKEYGLKPDECIFVTDTLGDLREAKKVGVPTIAVTWGYHSKTRLKKGKPDAMVHDFKELTKAIEKLKKK